MTWVKFFRVAWAVVKYLLLIGSVAVVVGIWFQLMLGCDGKTPPTVVYEVAKLQQTVVVVGARTRCCTSA